MIRSISITVPFGCDILGEFTCFHEPCLVLTEQSCRAQGCGAGVLLDVCSG